MFSETSLMRQTWLPVALLNHPTWKVSAIVASSSEMRTLLTPAACTAFEGQVRSMTATPIANLLKEKAKQPLQPLLDETMQEFQTLFPEGRISQNLAVYAGSTDTLLAKVMVEATALGCTALSTQAEVLNNTCKLLNAVYTMVGTDIIVGEGGIPDAAREVFRLTRTAMVPVSAYVVAPDFLSDLWKPLSGWSVGDLSSIASVTIMPDTLSLAASTCEKSMAHWSQSLDECCKSLEACTPPWQVHKDDLWGPASELALRGLIDGPAWSWPNPTALAKSSKLTNLLNQFKRLGKDVGGTLVSVDILKKGKEVCHHVSETSAMCYTLHVLLKVIPMLDTSELRVTAATTLKSQILSQRYSLPDMMWDALEAAVKTGTSPVFRKQP